MDEQRIEAVGLAPLVALLDEVDAASGSRQDLLFVMGRLERLGVGGLWQLFIDNDPGNPERYVVFLEQGGISLPDESYYRQEEFGEIREAFQIHLERVFTLVGFSKPGLRASRVLEVESALASQHWDSIRCRDAEATYNLWTLNQVTSALKEVSFEAWCEATGIALDKVTEVIIRQPSFV